MKTGPCIHFFLGTFMSLHKSVFNVIGVSFMLFLCVTQLRLLHDTSTTSQMLYWCQAGQVFQVSCRGPSPTCLSLIHVVANDALDLCFHLSSGPRQRTAEPGEIGSLFFIVIYSVFSVPLCCLYCMSQAYCWCGNWGMGLGS